MAKPPYPVGYKKPPQKHQFKPGHSGNPKGRPKGAKNLATDLYEELAEKLVVTEGMTQKRITKQRALVKALFARGLKGDTRAASILLKLLPNAELARQEAAESTSISKSDSQVLETFRQQLLAEILPPKKGKKS
jgi:hypothetical protein